MLDIEKRLQQVLLSGLEFYWPEVRVITTFKTWGEHCKNLCDSWPNNRFQPNDENKRRLIVNIKFPKSFIDLNPEYRDTATNPIVRSTAILLYALGLGAALAESEMSIKDSSFSFWIDPNEKTYSRLPPVLDGQLDSNDVTPSEVRLA